METPRAAAFQAASQFFVQAVGAVPPDRYEQPWSAEWRVLDLIGHGNRAHVLVVEWHERPVPVMAPEEIAEYLLPENIAQRGRDASVALGGDPVGAVRAASDRALAVIEAAPEDAVLGTPLGERTLDSYLRSRTAELVLHGLDLGTTAEPPVEALEECAAFLLTAAIAGGRGVEVIRALSGRGTLEPGFTVY